jgi:predicted RNA binding protein YcfA (HicA-like mRNA interferase family)
MSKLYSSREIQRAIEIMGFFFNSQKGSHGKFRNKNGEIVILPMNKKEIKKQKRRNCNFTNE